MIPGQRCLSLVQILCITFFIIRVFCPLCCVKYQLPDRHTGIYFYRARVDICHFKGNGTAEAGIDPAPGLVERYSKTGNARFAFNGGNDIIGQADTLQCLGKHKLPGRDKKSWEGLAAGMLVSFIAVLLVNLAFEPTGWIAAIVMAAAVAGFEGLFDARVTRVDDNYMNTFVLGAIAWVIYLLLHA